MTNHDLHSFAAALGRRGGKARAAALTADERSKAASKAGKARIDTLTPEQRSKIARKAAKSRWKGLEKLEES
jgi:hypothetical protein